MPNIIAEKTVQWNKLNSLSTAVYISEQVCIRWHRTGVYYTVKLTFFHCFPVKVWGAYYTGVCIIFEFLRYVLFYGMVRLLLKILQIGRVALKAYSRMVHGNPYKILPPPL